ncbi:MAG: hypothetical protein H7256_11410 [Bdellovibrio sp.]|nr:hypothetical protein [Bdellovibrio sp.]
MKSSPASVLIIFIIKENKEMKKQIIISIMAFMGAASAHAEFTNTKCEEILTGNDVIQVNRQWWPSSRTCFISVHPRQVKDLKYRDYFFDNTGRFMVFNSYGAGPDSTYTGARDFFLFPVINDYPDFSFEPNGDVLVKTVSGHILRVSGKDFSLVSLSDGTVKEKPLSTKNAGGVEITLKKGFWLDTGFRLGGLNIASPSNSTSFKSPKMTETCLVKNKTFMDYDANGEPDFKLTGDSFVQFVKAQCPKLLL